MIKSPDADGLRLYPGTRTRMTWSGELGRISLDSVLCAHLLIHHSGEALQAASHLRFFQGLPLIHQLGSPAKLIRIQSFIISWGNIAFGPDFFDLFLMKRVTVMPIKHESCC